MNIYILWIILGVALLVVEIFTLTFAAACVGLAFLAMALSAYYGAGTLWQILWFIIVLLISFLSLRPLAKKYFFKHSDKTKTNTAALIGREAKVTEEVNNAKEAGRIQLDGDSWRAVSHDGSVIPAGADVVTTKLEGATLTVRKK